MANTTSIEPLKVNKAGQTIVEQGDLMYKALSDIQGIVEGTKNYFQTDSADSARTNFQTSAAKFNDFKKYIKEYGEFLQAYGTTIQKTDAAIDEYAKKIPKL